MGVFGAGRWALDVLTWRAFLGHTVVYCSGSVLARFAVGQPLSQKLMRGWCAGVVRQVGMRIEAEGLDRLRGPPRVLVSNHLSALDIPVIGSQMPIDYRWVAKNTLFRMPFLGWHLWASGHIPVDRRRLGNLERMRAQVRDVFSVGGSVLFFAEGTRSRDGALQPFKNGAFATAVAESMPVQPIVVDGTERLLVKGSIRFPEAPQWPVRLRVLDPVAPGTGEPGAAVEALRDRVRAAMVEALDEMRGGSGRAETPTIAAPAG